MIRITELKLPLSAVPVEARRAADAPTETDQDRAPAPHPIAALTSLAAQALQIPASEIAALHVFKRSFDARKAELLVVYIVDLALTRPEQEAALLARFPNHPHIGPTPDMVYHPVGHAPADLPRRPVVVGFGPCGMFAALVLAQMGFKPLVLERGTTVRQRTKDTWGLWR
ncbi:MAG: FAD-dependent oxidoreductase, partial [Rhodoferax sp.]